MVDTTLSMRQTAMRGLGNVGLVIRGGGFFLDSLQGVMLLSIASHTCDTGPIGHQKITVGIFSHNQVNNYFTIPNLIILSLYHYLI